MPRPLCRGSDFHVGVEYTIPTHVSEHRRCFRNTLTQPNFDKSKRPSIFQIELFHDQLPLAVPCYDLVPVTELTLGPTYVETSGTPGSLDLTGGEYKT